MNIFDVVSFRPHFNAVSMADPRYNKRFDLNADGRINIFDIAILRPYFGKSCV